MLKRLLVLLVSFLVLCFSGSVAWSAGPPSLKNYSADLENSTPKGTFTSKIYSKDGKQRMERSGRGKDGITIVRPDKKVVWMLMPERKMYMEMPLDRQKQDIPSQLHDTDIKTEKEFLGNETVDGHPAKKYHVTIIRDGNKERSGFLWEATDLDDFPIKHQNEDGTTTTTWKNIKLGGISDSVFEIPAGYTRMDMPMPGMGDPRKQRK